MVTAAVTESQSPSGPGQPPVSSLAHPLGEPVQSQILRKCHFTVTGMRGAHTQLICIGFLQQWRHVLHLAAALYLVVTRDAGTAAQESLLAAPPPTPALHQLRPTISPRPRQPVSSTHLVFSGNIFWSLFLIKPLTAWLRHASGATLFVTALASVEKANRMRCLLFVPSRVGSHQYCRIVHTPLHTHTSQYLLHLGFIIHRIFLS